MRFTRSLAPNREFRKSYAKAARRSGRYLTLYDRKGRKGANRLGLTVTPKVGCAVVRNRVRRRLKEAYRLNEEGLKKGRILVIVARPESAGASFWELQDDLLRLFRRMDLLEPAISEGSEKK